MKSINETLEQRAAAKTRVRAVLFLVVGLVASLAALTLLRQYMAQMQSVATPSAPQTRMLVVAAVDVPIATRLEAAHLSVVSWPAAYVPAGAASDVNEVLQHTTRQDIVKGEAILAGRLADPSRGQGLAALLERGMRAMAVHVDDVVGVAGFVQPGDYVDVITTMQPDESTQHAMREEAQRISKVVLQHVRVLAVGEHLTTASKTGPISAKVVTLEVSPDESERLALSAQHGRLQLSLRARIDEEVATTAGITPAKLLVTGPAPEPVEAPMLATAKVHKRKPAVLEELKPEAPVVEILRGSTAVEQRKLSTPSAR